METVDTCHPLAKKLSGALLFLSSQDEWSEMLPQILASSEKLSEVKKE